MFDKMIPIVHKTSLVICDLDDTFFTKGLPCKFTDLDGFIQLFQHVKGNLIFLTGHPSKQEIKDRFNSLQLNYDDFTIFYHILHHDSKRSFFKKIPLSSSYRLYRQQPFSNQIRSQTLSRHSVHSF